MQSRENDVNRINPKGIFSLKEYNSVPSYPHVDIIYAVAYKFYPVGIVKKAWDAIPGE
jgi:hypothetical protein